MLAPSTEVKNLLEGMLHCSSEKNVNYQQFDVKMVQEDEHIQAK